MKTGFIALSFALLLIAPTSANACVCGGYPTVCTSYASAEAVFVGTVQRVDQLGAKKNEGAREDGSGQIAYVQVERVFKGTQYGEVTFRSWATSCDPVYKEGQRWLFYAYFEKKTKAWEIRACDRSRSVEDAADDLLYLQSLPESGERTRISGDLAHYENDPVKRFSRVKNIAGAKVRLTGGGKTYEVYTDSNGVYEIYGLPPGQYIIEPEIPYGLKIRFPLYYGEVDYSDKKKAKVVLREKGCAGIDFVFSANTSISGKVFGANGRALPNVCLSLQPKDKAVADNWLFDCTDKEGSYELDDIPPGEYMIVVNYHGKISSDEPFPRAYYPGVFEKERATVLSVGNGDRFVDQNIYIPSQEPTNVIQGVLLYSDGRPVAEGFVEFKADDVKEGYSGEVRAKTDANGRFTLTVLQGLKGQLYGKMFTYSGEYINCPKLEALIRAKGGRVPQVETNPVRLEIRNEMQGVKLLFPFPQCMKAKRD